MPLRRLVTRLSRKSPIELVRPSSEQFEMFAE
jgi:hypothetical protein